MNDFPLSAKEVSEIVKLPIQKIYTLRDCSTTAKSPRRPVLIQNKDWTFFDGKVLFSKGVPQLITEWNTKLSQRKDELAKKVQKPTPKVFVTINGNAVEFTGKTAKKFEKLVSKHYKPIDVVEELV